MTYNNVETSTRVIRLGTLTQPKAERLVFERLWVAFDNCDPKIMVTPEAGEMIEALRHRIVAGETLLRSGMNELMALVRVDPADDLEAHGAPLIWVQHAWFFGVITEYLDQNGDGPLPLGVAIQGLCDVSDGLFAVVSTDGEETTLRVTDPKALCLSGTLDISHDGPSLNPSLQLRKQLRNAFGCWEDAYSGSVA